MKEPLVYVTPSFLYFLKEPGISPLEPYMCGMMCPLQKRVNHCSLEQNTWCAGFKEENVNFSSWFQRFHSWLAGSEEEHYDGRKQQKKVTHQAAWEQKAGERKGWAEEDPFPGRTLVPASSNQAPSPTSIFCYILRSGLTPWELQHHLDPKAFQSPNPEQVRLTGRCFNLNHNRMESNKLWG